MGKRIYPLNGIFYWWAYTIEEICELYKPYGLHPQTVRTWINKNGLPAIKGSPTLIYGYNLKKFLGKMNVSGKCSTEFNELFCMKCKDAKRPYKRRVSLEHKDSFLKVKGHCPDCKSVMFQSYKMDYYQRLKKTFVTVALLELYDSTNPTVKTHLDAQHKQQVNEPEQTELF